MKPILETAGLSFGYGPSRWAVRNLSVSLEYPRRVCLLGANGAGKSTLLQLLNGTLHPCEGEIRIQGRAIDYTRAGLAALRREVGIVLQDPDDQLFAATVEQDVAFGLLNAGLPAPEARSRVARTLADLGIAHLADRPIHELSLGEKKRVAIAGVLVMGPRILLMDEPTAGLDGNGIAALLELLHQLHADGAAILLTTHDTELAYEWADEAWILAEGAITAKGPAVEVLTEGEALHKARLRMPILLETALVCRSLWTELDEVPLPATRSELFEQLRSAAMSRSTAELGGRR